MDYLERDSMIEKWLDAKMNLDFFKALEAERRVQVANYVLEVPDIKQLIEARTTTLKLGNGYGLKATNVINYTLDKIRIDYVIEELTKLGKADISSKCFKWEPKLLESEYKKLDNEDKAIIDQIVSLKVGSPKVEFIEPKGKK